MYRFYFILFLIFTSCKIQTKDLLMERSWGIKEITFNGENVRDAFLSNLLSFEEEGTCFVPFVHGIKMSKEDMYGKWSFNTKTKILTIKSKNPYINGDFKVCFKKDTKNKRIVLILTSDKVYIEALKGFMMYTGDGGQLPILCGDKE